MYTVAHMMGLSYSAFNRALDEVRAQHPDPRNRALICSHIAGAKVGSDKLKELKAEFVLLSPH